MKLLLTGLLLLGSSLAHAQSAGDLPTLLHAGDASRYRQAFDLIDRHKLKAVRAMLPELDGPLRQTVESELLLRGSARSNEVQAWLANNGDAPLAPMIARRAGVPGFDEPALPPDRKPRFGAGLDPSGLNRQFSRVIEPLLEAERPSDAEEQWRKLAGQPGVPDWVSSYWAYKIAWRYYLAGQDDAAARLGAEGGAKPCWEAAAALWVAGLAEWRGGNAGSAFARFSAILERPGISDDLRSAAGFWAARAAFLSGKPQRIADLLDHAGRYPETMYGLLALRTLGFTPRFDWDPPDFIHADWNQLSKIAGAQRAVALAQIGQLSRADRELRTLATRVDPQNFDALVRLAAVLNLPATQYWLSQRTPAGQTPPMSGRYPAPNWTPNGGWRVDQALVYAFALQESRFITHAVSRTGARGVMQLMPGTARMMQDSGEDETQLRNPEFNLELGQRYLETLRDAEPTRGLLPKVVAAYNAGPGSVRRWNESLNDRDDPLLFIESIPFAETRHYVEKVLANYWLYSLRLKQPTPSLDALARALWPRFPGTPGPAAIASSKQSTLSAQAGDSSNAH